MYWIDCVILGISMINLYHGYCLEVMKDIPTQSVDMILCDLPYGTTQNCWDSVIAFEPLWNQYERLIKPNGAIVLTAQPPFDKVLAMSNIKMFRYEWIWIKSNSTGFLNAHKMPMKATENVLVFYNSLPTYNPQMRQGFKSYRSIAGKPSDNYNKQEEGIETVNNGDRFPLNYLKIDYDSEKFHPTQKPVELMEYMIKTYTNENDLVLDNCMGSGTTGVACKRTNRSFIGIEKEKNYFDIAKKRIDETDAIEESSWF